MATGRKGKTANKLKNVFGEFTKGIEVKAELDADHPMIDATLQPLTTDSVTLNRKSLKELDTIAVGHAGGRAIMYLDEFETNRTIK